MRRLGYDARGWGLGINRGHPESDRDRLAAIVQDVATEHGPVGLVGWSLGGVIVREVARDLPDHVDGVVLFGSPIIGGPTHTIAARAFDPAEAALATAALYSRNDRVVNWKACVDRVTPSAKHVEVGSSHFGLLVDPDVWLAVAVALASNLATCAARVHPCAYSGISAGVAVAYRDRIVFQLRHSLASPVMRRASQM